MKSTLRSLLFLSLALFGLVAQGVVLPDGAVAQENMAGPVACATMMADRQPDADQDKGSCGLPECLAMAVAGCAAVTVPGAQLIAKLSPRAIPSYVVAVARAPSGVLPFPEIKPPII